MLTLKHFPLCPFSRKVRLTLLEKEIACDLQAIAPWQRGDELARLNPAVEVPVLVDGRRVVVDSAVICDYLDQTSPHPHLLGDDLDGRVEIRRLVAWFDVKFVREVTELVWREKVIKLARSRATPDSGAVRAGLANLHAHLAYIGFLFEHRNWLAGEALSLADIAAAAQISVLDYLGDVPWDRHPGAKLWYARIKSRPSFRPLLEDRLSGFRPAPHYDDLDF